MKRVSRDSLSPVVVSAISCRDSEDATGHPEVSGHSSTHPSTPSALVSPLTAGQSVDGRGRACTARGSKIGPKGKREAVGSPKPPLVLPWVGGVTHQDLSSHLAVGGERAGCRSQRWNSRSPLRLGAPASPDPKMVP